MDYCHYFTITTTITITTTVIVIIIMDYYHYFTTTTTTTIILIIIIIDYYCYYHCMLGVSLVPLGWSRLPLFRGGAEGYMTVESFVLLEGDTWVALHPGDVPDSLITTMPATPTQPPEGEGGGFESAVVCVCFAVGLLGLP